MRGYACNKCGHHSKFENMKIPGPTKCSACPDGIVVEIEFPESAKDKQVGGSHYKGDKIQHFEYVMVNGIPWGEAAAIKYIVRHAKKNGAEDIDKALHYLMMVRDHYYPNVPPKFKML